MDPTLLPALFDALTVARAGSVSAAAERLHKTPSAVSQAIRRLTDAAGVRLFEKRGRGIALTPAAVRILPEATRLFDQAESVFRLFTELHEQGPTLLRLAASDYLARPLLLPVLRDLATARVSVHFEIATVHSEEAQRRVERGESDMAIVSRAGDRPSLTLQPLLIQPFFWVMAPEKGRTATRVERMEREPLLRLAPGSLGRHLLDQLLEGENTRSSSTIDVASVSLLLAYVTGGLGIGLVPGLALLGMDRRRIMVERAMVEPIPVQLVSRRGWEGGNVVGKFISRLIAEAQRTQMPVEGADALPWPPRRRGTRRAR